MSLLAAILMSRINLMLTVDESIKLHVNITESYNTYDSNSQMKNIESATDSPATTV